jgi:hypothetical protein
MGAARLARPTHMCKQLSMRTRDLEVVLLDGDGGQHVHDERLAGLVPGRGRQLDTHQQLSYGDRRDRHVVVIVEQVVQPRATALGAHLTHRRLVGELLVPVSA